MPLYPSFLWICWGGYCHTCPSPASVEGSHTFPTPPPPVYLFVVALHSSPHTPLFSPLHDCAHSLFLLPTPVPCSVLLFWVSMLQLDWTLQVCYYWQFWTWPVEPCVYKHVVPVARRDLPRPSFQLCWISHADITWLLNYIPCSAFPQTYRLPSQDSLLVWLSFAHILGWDLCCSITVALPLLDVLLVAVPPYVVYFHYSFCWCAIPWTQLLYSSRCLPFVTIPFILGLIYLFDVQVSAFYPHCLCHLVPTHTHCPKHFLPLQCTDIPPLAPHMPNLFSPPPHFTVASPHPHIATHFFGLVYTPGSLCILDILFLLLTNLPVPQGHTLFCSWKLPACDSAVGSPDGFGYSHHAGHCFWTWTTCPPYHLVGHLPSALPHVLFCCLQVVATPLRLTPHIYWHLTCICIAYLGAIPMPLIPC